MLLNIGMRKNFVLFSFFVMTVPALFVLRMSVDDDLSNYVHKSIFIPPPERIELMSFGFNEVIADSFWIRWIQNIDSCGKGLQDRSSVLESKVDVSNTDLSKEITKTQKSQVCDQGWAFRMLDAVTSLSPKFRMPYALGASTLSILTEDHIGAQKIYEKAFVHFPNDWAILYRGAYHFLYELNDLPRAAELLKQAADNGAPDWLYSLSSRVSSQAGQLEFGILVLQDYISTVTDANYRQQLELRLQKMRQQLNESIEGP